ncbi:MAG: hypothetical protein J6V54_08415 [Bacteroidales bacterium]|nr:hypothetical protein [Bacteroidales bacterium]
MKNQKDKLVLITAVFTLPLFILYQVFRTPFWAVTSDISLVILAILIIGRIIKP